MIKFQRGLHPEHQILPRRRTASRSFHGVIRLLALECDRHAVHADRIGAPAAHDAFSRRPFEHLFRLEPVAQIRRKHRLFFVSKRDGKNSLRITRHRGEQLEDQQKEQQRKSQMNSDDVPVPPKNPTGILQRRRIPQLTKTIVVEQKQQQPDAGSETPQVDRPRQQRTVDQQQNRNRKHITVIAHPLRHQKHQHRQRQQLRQRLVHRHSRLQPGHAPEPGDDQQHKLKQKPKP